MWCRLGFWGLLLVTACLSEDKAQDKWDAWVADHASCTSDDDCVLVSPGCPLGCFDAVNARYEQDAEKKAERLIRRVERGGTACQYKCAAIDGVRCELDRCVVVPWTP